MPTSNLVSSENEKKQKTKQTKKNNSLQFSHHGYEFFLLYHMIW